MCSPSSIDASAAIIGERALPVCADSLILSEEVTRDWFGIPSGGPQSTDAS